MEGVTQECKTVSLRLRGSANKDVLQQIKTNLPVFLGTVSLFFVRLANGRLEQKKPVQVGVNCPLLCLLPVFAHP